MQNKTGSSNTNELSKNESDFVFFYTQAALSRFKIRNIEEHINSDAFDKFDARNKAFVIIKDDIEEALNLHVRHLRNQLLTNPIDAERKEELKKQCIENVRDMTRREIFTINAASQKIGQNLLVARTTGDSRALNKVQDMYEEIGVRAVEFGKDIKKIAREYISEQAETIFAMMHEQLTKADGKLDFDRVIVIPFAKTAEGKPVTGSLQGLREGMRTLFDDGYLDRSVEDLDKLGLEKAKEMRTQASLENISQVFSEIDNDLAPEGTSITYFVEQVSSYIQEPANENAFNATSRILESASLSGYTRAEVLSELPEDALKNYQEMHKQFSSENKMEDGTTLSL